MESRISAENIAESWNLWLQLRSSTWPGAMAQSGPWQAEAMSMSSDLKIRYLMRFPRNSFGRSPTSRASKSRFPARVSDAISSFTANLRDYSMILSWNSTEIPKVCSFERWISRKPIFLRTDCDISSLHFAARDLRDVRSVLDFLRRRETFVLSSQNLRSG
jgi:hypothetical protein